MFLATTKVTSIGKPLLGGPWTLIDCDTKRAVTNKSFEGKFTLLYFGFTHCPDICPNELVRIGDVLDRLAKENLPEVVPLFVTVDPNRDTVAQMQEYKKGTCLFFVSLLQANGVLIACCWSLL